MGKPIRVRNPDSIRPWQHVLEPLSGYMHLGATLGLDAGARPDLACAYNFGPGRDSERTVEELVEATVEHRGNGSWECTSKESFSDVHEAVYLKLATDRATVSSAR
mgnify:CR=1 FL=1